MKPSSLLIFFLSILIGVFLRLHDLNLLSPWSDELASIYYAKNLSLVFSEETHSPFFYAFLSPFVYLWPKDVATLRCLVGLLCISLNLISTYLASRIFSKQGTVLFTILLWLCPVDFIHSRMIRQYGIFFELTVLLMLIAELKCRKIWSFLVSMCLVWIHPLGFIPVLSVLTKKIYQQKRSGKDLWPYIISLISIGAYYSLKWLTLSRKIFFQNYTNSSERKFDFLHEVVSSLAGEHYPRINFYPISSWVYYGMLICLVSVILLSTIIFFRKKALPSFTIEMMALILFSLLVTYSLSFLGVDIKLGRYFIFLMAGFILVSVSILEKWQASLYFVFALQLFFVVEINPFLYFPGEREAMKSHREKSELVLCANKFQYDFYLSRPVENCDQQFQRMIREKKDFQFIMLNSYGLHVLSEASKTYEIENFRRYGIPISATLYWK